jgi:hypothetical protein
LKGSAWLVRCGAADLGSFSLGEKVRMRGMPTGGSSPEEEFRMDPIPINLYFDYKSPFAYLAKDEAYTLEEDYQVTIEWLPYVLDIPEALGDSRPVSSSNGGKFICSERSWTR